MKKILLSTLVLLLTALSMYAQVTTSSLTGTVSDSKGETLPGASVVAVHTPSGTRYSTAANVQGKFTILNMRVGGPYSVEVTYIGYQAKKVDDLSLQLGEPYVLNLIMQESGTALQEVVITSTDSRSVLNADRTGSTTNLGRTQIQNVPTITRSVNDLTRFTPQANGTSIGGGNYRSNNFTVDGSNFNNSFGIGSNVPANGSPISLDALEQISINVTPYDVRQSGFTGGSINAVTRAGTNKFFGSAFVTTRTEDEQGTKVSDVNLPLAQRYAQNQFGFSFGGPIIKDKLFYFVNGEFLRQGAPGQNRMAATPGRPYNTANPNVSRPTADQLNNIRNYLITNYNYDPGTYQGYQFNSNNDKLLARLDWNINSKNRLNLRYNQVESKSPSFVSTSRSPFASFANSRTSNFALPFSNSNYYQDQNLYSFSGELNSTFGKFSNTFRGSYTNQNDPRSSDSDVFPFVDILEGGNPFTSFGYEPFTYGNLRDVKSKTFTDYVNATFGKHNLTAGIAADFSTTKNGFQRYGTSYYTFASYSDFVNGAKPQDYAITYSLSPGYEQAFPTFKFAQYTAYIQDEFNVSDRIKVTAGLRADQFAYPSVPEIKTHPLVASLSFANGEKIDTGELPESKIQWSPRIGFNWDVKGDRSLQVRGGSGIFTGKVPFVWIVAQSGDAGLIQFTQTYLGQANTPGKFNPDPRAYLPETAPAAGTSIPSAISAISPNFKNPQTWKSNLALDFKLPWNIVGTFEGIYNRDLNSAIGRNANLVNPTALNISGYPDTRPFYPSSNTQKFVNPLTPTGQASVTGTNPLNVAVLDNTSGGYNWTATALLSKQFSKGISAMVAYTRSEAKNYGDGTGDQLLNLWSIPQTSTNSNIPSLSYTNNLNPDRIIASVSYRKEFLKNLSSSISLFYEGAIQGRFSYTYSGDFNRDGQTNDLIYIPRDPSEITFVANTLTNNGVSTTYTPQQQSDIFFKYIAQDKYLSKHQGEYAERNGAKMPWRNQVDFKFTQEVFKNISKTKNSFQFTWDVFNFGNLLNKDWGNVNFVRNSAILSPTNTALISNTVRPTYRLASANGELVANTFGTTQTFSSTYYMQFGFRYNFQ